MAISRNGFCNAVLQGVAAVAAAVESLSIASIGLLTSANPTESAWRPPAPSLMLRSWIPSSLMCVSSSALIAITAELPEIESAAISGESVKG